MYTKNCPNPNCSREMHYKNLKSFKRSNERNTICNSCRNSGENNAMYGKSLYETWVKKYGEDGAKQKQEEFNLKASNRYENMVEKYGQEEADKRWGERFKDRDQTGDKNPMAGKSIYSRWLEKYGKEEADLRYINWKANLSKASSGENNGMYGKPSPIGSGNGWKGWYKNIYFASLKELFYMKQLFDNNIKFENGEQKKFKIQYEFMGKKANYFLDFYLPETDEYVEIKPIKLTNSPRNYAKFIAAKGKLGDKFKILTEKDTKEFDLEEMYSSYLNKDLIWMDKYEEKFKEYYEKNRVKEDLNGQS